MRVVNGSKTMFISKQTGYISLGGMYYWPRGNTYILLAIILILGHFFTSTISNIIYFYHNKVQEYPVIMYLLVKANKWYDLGKSPS